MEHLDTFLGDIAEHFNCSIPSVWVALKKLAITLKKTTTDKEQDSEKVRHYRDVLACSPEPPVVYIDETGIDTYLYRQKLGPSEVKRFMIRLVDDVLKEFLLSQDR